MLRKARLMSLLVSVAVCLVAIVRAQEPGLLVGTSSPTGNKPAVAAANQLAQAPAATLAERLRAIRRGSSSQPETATETVQTDQLHPEATQTTSRATDVPDTPGLRSVLVRPSGRSKPAPVVKAPVELKSLGRESAQRTRQPNDASNSSTRRSTRFAKTPPRPYQRPSSTQAGRHSSANRLALSGETPSIRVETEGPKAIMVGQPANYRVRLVNQGRVAVQNVIVVVTLSDSVEILGTQVRHGTVAKQGASGAHRIVWQMEQTAAQSQHELTISLKPTTKRSLELQVDWTFRPASLVAKVVVRQPELAIAIVGPSEMRYGETKVFKVRLSNPGNGPAENVAVHLTTPGAATQPNQVGALAAGEVRELELELTARQAGTMEIRAVANGSGQLNAQASHKIQVRRAQLVVKVVGPRLVFAGSTAKYQIHVANHGDAEAEDVVLAVTLPRGAENGLGIDKKPITDTTPRWRMGTLAAGKEQTYSLECDLTAAGQNPVTVQVQSVDKLAAVDTTNTQVEAVADLKLVVNDPKGPVPVGQDVAYEIEVINRGSKEAHDILVIAQFSDGVEPASAKGQPSEIVPGQVVFDPIRTLPAGGRLTLKVTASAHKSGNHRFRAELTCSDPETKLMSEETTRYYGDETSSTSSTSPAAKTAAAPIPARR